MRALWIQIARLLAIAVLLAAVFCRQEAGAQAENVAGTHGGSGLLLPRFVTLKSARVNMRVGPDQNKYPVLWIYHCRGLPVEIIQEYENWRRIRDSDGAVGWVNAALLSGKRAAVIQAHAGQQGQGSEKEQAAVLPLYASANTGSAVVMKAEPGVIGAVKRCDGHWCLMEIADNRGFIEQEKLWGVYPAEIIP